MSKKNFTKENLPKDSKAEELEGKVQTTGQDDKTQVNVKANDPLDPAVIKDVNQPKPAINTNKAAEVVSAGSTSVGVGGGALLRATVVFGGSAGAIKDDMSATTREDRPYGSGSRMGRRLDPITRKIDTIMAEQFKTEIKQSKPLAETDEKQGYNGNYFNEHAITQKVNGGAPADPLFERSIDQISIDTVYFPQGQLIRGHKKAELSINTWELSDYRRNKRNELDPVKIKLGNYLPRKLFLKLEDGELTEMALQADDIAPGSTDEAITRLASDSYLRMLNQSELDRNAMISIAGNESDPGWSCLGDSIIDATDQNRFLRLFESMVGDFVFTTGRNLEYARSYQVNKTAKDGARLTGPMAEMLNGLVEIANYGWGGAVPENATPNGRALAFSPAAFRKGGSGLYITINDSTPKYTTKGKLMALPLSFQTAAATLKSNMDPLVMDQDLPHIMAKNELFSTIDGPYDPLKPIVVTNGKGLAPLMHPFVGGVADDNFTDADNKKHKVLKFTNSSNFVIYTQHYENLRNKYNIDIKNYFAQGLWEYFRDRQSRLWNALGHRDTDTGTDLIEIPVVSTITSLSLWDLFLGQATPYIIEARLRTLTELLKYEKNHGYPYTGLIHLKDVNLTEAENFTFSDSDSPLTTAIAKPVAALKVILPEVFWPVSKFDISIGGEDNKGVGANVVLPHYFVQNQFKLESNDRDAKLLMSDDATTMAYPSFRTGTNLTFADTIYGMTEEDYRLALDRMVTYPAYEGDSNDSKRAISSGFGTNHKTGVFTYKYGLSTDGIPVIGYNVYVNDTDNKDHCLTVRDVMSTPRELGYYMVAPAGVLTPTRDSSGHPNYVDLDSSYFLVSGPSFSLRFYHVEGRTPTNGILEDGSTNITENAAFRNVYAELYAVGYDALQNNGFVINAFDYERKVMPFVNGSYTHDAGAYDPSTGTYAGSETPVTQASPTTGFTSIQRYLWTRLQRLPFVVNPFDVNTADLTSAGHNGVWDTLINTTDPYDFMYIFGLCGFRASDFSQLVYERNRARIVNGMNYVSDPFVDKSMLLK